MINITHKLQHASAGESVLQINVLRNKARYNITGVLMGHTDTLLTIAYNARDDVVVDKDEILISEIEEINFIDEKDIETIS